MSDYDKSIHSNPDAQAWAKFFISTVEEQSWRIEDIDESLMTGWFANAMMAMHDHVKKEWVGLTDVNEMVEAELTHYCNGEYDYLTGARDHLTDFARAIEAKLKEKNT